MSYSLYRPSGVVPAGAYPLAAACLAATLPIACLYAWLIVHLPAVLNVFLACAFSFAMAGLVKGVCGMAKVRSPAWVGGFGLVLGACGWYLQWAAWAALQLEADPQLFATFSGALALAAQPERIAATVIELLSATSASFAGMPLKALMVLAWLGELWVLLFFPQYMGKMRAEDVYDEAAGRWAGFTELPGQFRKIGQPALIDMLASASGRLSDILVPIAGTDVPEHARLRIYSCEGRDPLVEIVNVEKRAKDGLERVSVCSPGIYLSVPETELQGLERAAPACEDAAETDPPALTRAIGYLRAGQLQAAYDEALPFTAAADLRLACDANRICAIVCSDAKKWVQACDYWQALFAREATAHNALQLATSAIMAGRLEQGIRWGERACAINASFRELPAISIITNLVSALTAAQQLAAALPYLEQIKTYYTELHVTDPTFLFAHRMPLFHVFLEKSGAVVKQVLDEGESRQWYASMLPHLDERGQAELHAWLAGEGAPA